LNKRVLLNVSVCVVVLVLVFSLTSFAQETEKDALDLMVERGKLVMSIELGMIPFGYEDPKTGEITGMSIELARMYCEDVGVELEVQNFEWAGVIPALLSKKVDMVVAPLSRTMARSLKILYTEPYLRNPMAIGALKGKYEHINDLNQEGVIIGCNAGSSQEEMIPILFPKATPYPVPTRADYLVALAAGRADAVFSAYVDLKQDMKNNPNIEILPGNLPMDTFACAVRFDSFKLWTSFNIFMRLIKLDGRYGELYEKWLGVKWEPLSIETAL